MSQNWLPVIAFLAILMFSTAKALTCYNRSATVGHDSGSVITCLPGDSYCYSYSLFDSRDLNNYAGCSKTNKCKGRGEGQIISSCHVCTTDNCNSILPSSISCYHRVRSHDDGIMVSCATGITSCFIDIGVLGKSGCGKCPAAIDMGFNSCIECSTNNCNTLTPSSISCNYGEGKIGESLRTYNASCPSGFSTCYSFTTGFVAWPENKILFIAGCGTCSKENLYGSCVTCSTNNCNTLLPSSISCWHRKLSLNYPGNNGKSEICATGITSCYSYTVGFEFSNAGCGVCSSAVSSKYGCKTCDSDNCNVNASLRVKFSFVAVVSCAMMLAVMKLC